MEAVQGESYDNRRIGGRILLKKVKEHQTERYIYRYCRSDCTSGEDAEIMTGSRQEESYFYDVRNSDFIRSWRKTKNDTNCNTG